MNSMHDVYFSLGSNLGNRWENLRIGMSELQNSFQWVRSSSVYETEPWGYEDNKAYLNQVAWFKTIYTPLEVLYIIQKIEKKAGRKKEVKKSESDYYARTLDVDLLFYDHEVYNDENLVIPHPRLHKRNFVLVPFAEINDSFVHPVLLKTIRELVYRCSDRKEIKRVERPV